MSVKAKFRCLKVEAQTVGYENVSFEPRYEDGDDAVNKSWSEATPSGQLEMCITNPALMGHFKPGRQYMVTIEEAPEAEQDG